MFGQHTAIGLDLGSDTIRIVRAERHRRGEVVFTHAASLHLPRESDDAAPFVQRWLNSLGLGSDPGVIGLSGRSTILKPLELEAGDPRTVEQAAALEVQKLRKLTSEDVLYDVATTSSCAGKRTALLFVVRPDTLDAVLELPAHIGTEIMDVIPSSVAVFNLTHHLAPPADNTPVVGVNIGYRVTELTVGTREGMRFARSFDIGAVRFAEALASAKGIPVIQAHELLLTDPSLLAAANSGAHTPLTDVLHVWLTEIELTLAIDRDRFQDITETPCEITLTGEGARLKGLPDILAERTSLRTAIFSGLPLPGTISDPASYMLAAGLAREGITHGLTRISLALPAMKARRHQQRDRWTWAAAAALVVAAGLTVFAGSCRATSHAHHLEEQASRQSEIRDQLRSRLVHLQQDNRQLLATLKPVYQLAQKRLNVLELVRAVGEAKGNLDWFVSMTTLPGSSNLLSGPVASSFTQTNDASDSLQVLLRGYTPDARFYSVRSMIDHLQQNPRILNADLLDEAALTLTDPLASLWTPLNTIPFTLCIQTRNRPEAQLPVEATLPRAAPVTQTGLARAIREQEILTQSILSGWDVVSRDYSTFKNRADIFNLPSQEEAALIDFRVALQETRRKLLEQAARHGTAIPSDLGLQEAAGKDKNVRRLLFQLATIRKLADIALEQGVSDIGAIHPLESEVQTAGNLTCMEQYPIRITLRSRLPVLLGLLNELGNSQHFMGIRQITMTRTDPTTPDMLHVTLEVSSLVFPEPPDAATLTAARSP